MNPYENALAQVVDHMLSERKCCVMNSQVRNKLAMMLRMRKSDWPEDTLPTNLCIFNP